MLVLILILIFAAFAKPAEDAAMLWQTIFNLKWIVTGGLLVILGFILYSWFKREEMRQCPGGLLLGIHETDLSPAVRRCDRGGISAGPARDIRH